MTTPTYTTHDPATDPGAPYRPSPEQAERARIEFEHAQAEFEAVIRRHEAITGKPCLPNYLPTETVPDSITAWGVFDPATGETTEHTRTTTTR